ncbi:unnamed protein product [Prunus brigantina]
MEDFDDDFGELYAGVEMQANSAINGIPNFAHLYTEPEEDINDDDDDHKAKNARPGSEEQFVSDSKKPDSVCQELGEQVSGLEANEDYSGSDSEDDLKIVLNDEDCEGQMFPVAGRGSMKNDEDEDDDGFVATKEYKYVRTQGYTCPSNGKANEAVGLVSSMLVRGDHDNNNMRNQRKGSSSHIACVRDTPHPVLTQNRYGFRLPWYRTILDVNVESFEEKPWRYPGVDLTDYFNFGLNEDSWKQYCNSLEQHRLTSMQFGIPVPDSSKLYQAKEAGSEYDKFAQETISKDMNHADPRKHGPPSRFFDSRVRQLELPKGRAIQIEDSIIERQPSFDSRHPRSLDSDVVIQITVQGPTEETSDSGEGQGCTNGTVHEASANGEFVIPSSNIAKEDDLSVGSLKGNSRRLDRCSQQMSPMAIDSDNHRNNQAFDQDGYDHKQVNAISLETIEIANQTTESIGRNAVCADQSMMEAQLSLGDDDQLSPTSSCFVSDSEASNNSDHFDPEDIHTPVRSTVHPHIELCKSVGSSCKNSKGIVIKRKVVDVKDYPACGSPAPKKRKHQDRRLDSVVEPNVHRKDDHDASPTSETDDLYDRDHYVNSRRQKKRPQDFSCSHREDISDYEESSHYGIRYTDNHVQTANTNYWNRKGRQKFQDTLDPYVRKTWNEREYSCEERDADWHHFGRTQFTKERSPLTNRESRGLHSRYSSHTAEERDAPCRRNSSKLQFKKIPNPSGGFNYKCEDDFVGEKFGRCVSFTDQKRKFPQVRRELKNSRGRGGHVDSPVLYWDDSCSGKTKDQYCRHRENRYLSHQSYTADEERWNDSLSPRNDVSYSRATDERYWRHASKIYSAEAKESNWFDSHNTDEIDDIIYPNDHLRWRRSNWRSEVLQWTEDQLTVRDHGDKLYSKKGSVSYQKYVRNETFHVKYGSSHDAMHIDDLLPEQHRLKMMRKRSSAKCMNRSSMMGKHEQTIPRCRDSTDLIVGEGKSSGRCSKGRTLMCNDRRENMDPEIGGARTTLVGSSESEKWAVQFSIPKVQRNQNNENRLEAFPVTGQNDDLDMEDGQIVTEELTTAHPLQRKHASEYAVPAHNVKRRPFNNGSASHGNKVVEGYDNQRILETMAKMEKRGERFKESITLKKEPDKLSKPEVDLLAETSETKQHRPARKRRWGVV